MKNLKPIKKQKQTLSLTVLKLRYKQARSNRSKKLFISDIRKTKDVRWFLADLKSRGHIRARSDCIILL